MRKKSNTLEEEEKTFFSIFLQKNMKAWGNKKKIFSKTLKKHTHNNERCWTSFGKFCGPTQYAKSHE